jgi:hypothetical protein
MPAGQWRVLKAMIGTSDNDTGEIYRERGRSLEVLAGRAKMSPRTARRWYAEIVRDGWHEPAEGSGKDRVYGMMHIPPGVLIEQGRFRECEREGCGKPLKLGARADIRFCSDRCRKAAKRASLLADSPDRALAQSPDTEPAALADSPDVSGILSRTRWPIARTNASSESFEADAPYRDSTERWVNSNRLLHGDGTFECLFCHQLGGGDLGVIQHRPDCWDGMTLKLFDS